MQNDLQLYIFLSLSISSDQMQYNGMNNHAIWIQERSFEFITWE